MEPTSSPDNPRPSPGLSRFWQTLPEPETPDPVETPADLLPGSPLGTFHSHPIPPLAPIASAARHPSGADPFGLNRAPEASRRHPPDSDRAAPEEDRDTDHSVPSDEQGGPLQDVQSQEPGGGPFGGLDLGGRFGPGERADERHEQADDSPADDEPVDHDPPDSGRDSAETADDSDENGRDDMNGRAGAPGYAQTGEAGPDGTGDAATEPQGPAEPVRSAAGWASVPSQAQPVTPTSGGPVSGVPVSPAYANPYSVADFTPDHPAANLQSAEPVPAAPVPAPAAGSASVPVSAVSPMSPAAPVSPVYLASPVSPASPVHPASPATPAPLAEPEEKAEEKEEKPVPAIHASVQIPLTRPPADEPVEQPAPDSGYGYTPAGYSLGRTPEVYGVASVTPAPVSAPPQPPLFPAAQEFPAVAAKEFAPIVETSLTIDVPARRSADPEDADQPRRAVAARRVVPAEESVPVEGAPSDEPLIARTVWDEDAARHFRAAWHEVKAEFVDDPVTALTRAHDLLTDAVNELTEVLLAERDELDPLRGTDTPDTESMRMAMRGYREYLERILSL